MRDHRDIPVKRPDASERVKRARPNRMSRVQVMPPHHVDLTLAPDPAADIHVPAHVTGGDLSNGGPASSIGKSTNKH